MADNISVIPDPHYLAYSDWIEIYNSENYTINLKNYSITDDLSNPQKYVFTSDVYAPAGRYLIIWTDDMNNGIHTNFKLSASGESIGLYSPTGQLIDTLSFGQQGENISQGRYPNGGIDWFKFLPSSPGLANNNNNFYNKLSEPVFSLQGGFYQTPFTLSISHADSAAQIYYTIDGTTPTTNSILYQSPIQIDSTTTVTARAFKSGYNLSNTIVSTYFIDFNTDLPVFSIVTDPANFFSDTTGIYVVGTRGITGNCATGPRNWNQEWERPVNLEFFEKDKTLAFNVKAGVKIYGGCSRIYDMKSLALYFRDQYGEGRLNYRLFPESQVLSYNNFVLRSGGQDWWRTMLRQGLMVNLSAKNMKIANLHYKPSLVFINGRYWGIHDLIEKINPEFLNSHYGVNPDSIDLISISKNVAPTYGDGVAYNSMIAFLTNNDISNSANYNYIKSIVDIDDYIDYQILQLYGANGDWPGSNMKLWRERSPNGKWRWLLYDVDFVFGGNDRGWYNVNSLAAALATDGPDWPNPPWSTLMLRKLLTNTEFKNEFVQRFAAHMNTTFDSTFVLNVIDSLKNNIANEIPRHKSRWVKSITLGPDWETNIEVMRYFARVRRTYMRSFINTQFNINGSYSLNISRNNPDWGKVYTHNIEVEKNNSLNIFFMNIPVKVKAFAMPGYRFVRWEGISQSTSPDITIITNNNNTLKAVFEPITLTVTKPVINEINYNTSSDFDCGEWIELYNPSQTKLDISGWKLSDGNIDSAFVFPDSSFITANGYLVVCKDSSRFNSLHLNVKNVYGNLNYGLNNVSDIVMLFDNSGTLIDSVKYLNVTDWPIISKGGPSIALLNPQYDNTQGLNWKASYPYGTPSRMNDVYSKNEDKEISQLEFHLYDNYPNPFNPSTTIRYSIPNDGNVSLVIYDALGREVMKLFEGEKSKGEYSVDFDASNLGTGVYFYRLVTNDFVQTKKMMLLK